jgi:hypothetical protein
MNRLEWAVKALSQPHKIQEALFPDFVEVADELALTFEEAMMPYTNCPNGLDVLTIAQRAALLNLDNCLARMSGQANFQNWTMEALVDSVEWENVRNFAKQVLIVMNWSLSPPPGNPDIYVCGPR